MGYVYFNSNPLNKNVGDCAVRAVSKALNLSWRNAYMDLCLTGMEFADMPNSDFVWGNYLKERGFVKHLLPDYCPDCYTVAEFAEDHPYGIFTLGTGSHAVSIVGGNYYDSFDSGNEPITYYWEKER